MHDPRLKELQSLLSVGGMSDATPLLRTRLIDAPLRLQAASFRDPWAFTLSQLLQTLAYELHSVPSEPLFHELVLHHEQLKTLDDYAYGLLSHACELEPTVLQEADGFEAAMHVLSIFFAHSARYGDITRFVALTHRWLKAVPTLHPRDARILFIAGYTTGDSSEAHQAGARLRELSHEGSTAKFECLILSDWLEGHARLWDEEPAQRVLEPWLRAIDCAEENSEPRLGLHVASSVWLHTNLAIDQSDMLVKRMAAMAREMGVSPSLVHEVRRALVHAEVQIFGFRAMEHRIDELLSFERNQTFARPTLRTLLWFSLRSIAEQQPTWFLKQLEENFKNFDAKVADIDSFVWIFLRGLECHVLGRMDEALETYQRGLANLRTVEIELRVLHLVFVALALAERDRALAEDFLNKHQAAVLGNSSEHSWPVMVWLRGFLSLVSSGSAKDEGTGSLLELASHTEDYPSLIASELAKHRLLRGGFRVSLTRTPQLKIKRLDLKTAQVSVDDETQTVILSPVQMRLLQALASHAASRSSEASLRMSLRELSMAVWPDIVDEDERNLRNRVHVNVHRLRARGFEKMISVSDDGVSFAFGYSVFCE